MYVIIIWCRRILVMHRGSRRDIMSVEFVRQTAVLQSRGTQARTYHAMHARRIKKRDFPCATRRVST